MTSFKRNSPPPVFHGQATVGNKLAGPQGTRSPVEYRVSYINNLYSEVTIGWRSGFSFTLPASEERFGETLIIRVEIALAPWVRIDVEKLLVQVRSDANSELKAMKEAIEVQSSKSRHGGTLLTLDYPVTIQELKKYGGAVYYSELDQVVSILPQSDSPAHPYSEMGRQQYVQDTHGFKPLAGFNYNLEIVDNTRMMGARFVNINGSVFPLHPIVAYGRRDGVYVRTSGAVDDHGQHQSVVKRLSYSTGMEELGIFKSQEEASALGDLVARRKIQEAETEAVLSKLKHDVVVAKQSWELEKLEKEKELRADEEERERRQVAVNRDRERQVHDLELRRFEVKDHYESRSYVRKDSSEVVKSLPTAIMGLGAIVMAIKAFL